MKIREIVFREIACVASEQKKSLPPLEDRLELVSTGLDSLCLAILVARLEHTLGIDPFADENVILPVTLGDLARLYQSATTVDA